MLSDIHFIHVDLHLQPQVGGDLLHVLHPVSREGGVGQKHTADTLQASTRRGHVP